MNRFPYHLWSSESHTDKQIEQSLRREEFLHDNQDFNDNFNLHTTHEVNDHTNSTTQATNNSTPTDIS